MKQKSPDVSDSELKIVIADFLEMGHVENIVAMFRRTPFYYTWVGELLKDERFNVRLGLSVLFEEMAEIAPEQLHLAIPSLKELLKSSEPLYRGEALSLLGIIGTEEASNIVHAHLDDDNQQVREMAELVVEEIL